VQLIRIAGPAAALRRLAEVEGLQFERTSARQIDGDRWQVSGYASDDAVAKLEERGLDVEAQIERQELEDQRKVLFERLDAARAREAQE
jgi:hypothetical protein